MNAKTPNLHAMDAAAFARAGATLAGRLTAADLPRLREMLAAPDLVADVAWTAQGQQRPGVAGDSQLWLHLTAQTRAPLPCQRCLDSVCVALDVNRAYRFVADEAQASAEDADSHEDLLSLAEPLDLVALIEDELIMAAPFAPHHTGSCPEPQTMQFEDSDFAAAQCEKPHPFAALAALKNPAPKS